jgi:hypothetical protein
VQGWGWGFSHRPLPVLQYDCATACHAQDLDPRGTGVVSYKDFLLQLAPVTGSTGPNNFDIARQLELDRLRGMVVQERKGGSVVQMGETSSPPSR